MYTKLSIRNVKRSFFDYSIYFMTLMIAVCLFYTFDSINEQQIMLEISTNQKAIMEQLSDLLTIVSIVVSVIICFLCLFANQFLIKRRKKEFGLYMILGMSKLNISKILIFESTAVGLISLVSGLLLGVLVSQGMAIFTASLFDVSIKGYQFVFSAESMIRTIVFFAVIFLLVLIFNVIVVSRYKLIDLLTSMKKNEKMKLKNVKVSGVLFLLSLLMIVGGYTIINTVSIGKQMTLFVFGIVIIFAATILFFYSGVSFLLTMTQKRKSSYFKGLNVFVNRQISSKANTSFASISIISISLFFTIAILSTGLSYKYAVEQDLKTVAPYDATLVFYPYDENSSIEDFDEMLKESKVDFHAYQSYVRFPHFSSDLLGAELLKPYAEGTMKEDIEEGFPININVIRYSDYIKLMEMQGIKPLQLKDGETFLITNVKDGFPTIKNYLSHEKQVEIAGTELKISEEGYHYVAIETETLGRTMGCFVVPDSLVKDLRVINYIYNFDYGKEEEKQEKFFLELIESFMNKEDEFGGYSVRGITKGMAYEEVVGQTTSFIYVGIYLGLIFLITSGAVLAIQQLSEASDSMERYQVLRRIGSTEKQMNNAIGKQILITFLTPLSLALVHSAFTIYYVNKNFVYSGAANTLYPACITAVVLVLVYGGYLYGTYRMYKKIVKKE